MSTMLDWARWWQSLGCAVYPLPPLRKKPAVGGLGIRSATTNLAQIEAWWTAQPDANIGVVGDPAATDRFLLRVDIDPKRAGDVAWQTLVAANPCPETLTVRTPSGGHHYYFTTSHPYSNGTGTLPAGIDIRGHVSGYTVGAASTTSAVPGESVAGHYELVNAVGMAAAPEWLLALLDSEKRIETQPVEALTSIDDTAYAELRDALLSPGMLRDWERWSDNGLALRTLGERGYALWIEYSARQLEACGEPEGADTADTWWARHGTTGIKSDYRSIFTRAQALGWKNPRAVDPSQLGFGEQPLPAQASAVPVVSAQTGRKFQLLTEDQFTSGPDPVWRIDGILLETGLALIFGPSGVGKSFFTLDVLGCIADGREYGTKQHQVKQARCVYVMAEGAGGMRKRVRAYRKKYPARHNNLNIIAAAPNMMTPADVVEMSQVVMEAGGAKVIVFDTMHACMAGADENSAKDVGILLANARMLADCLGALVVFVHHTGKDEDRGARGSSSIKAAMDTQIQITQNPTDGSKRIARIEKQRDGESDFSWEYTLEPVVEMGVNPFASAVVKHTDRVMAARSESRPRPGAKTPDFAISTMQSMVEEYPDGVPFEILIAQVARNRSDLRHDNIRRAISSAIDRGQLSIDSESVVKLAWA